MKTITLLLALAFAARAQYATSANSNAGGSEMNTKPAWQTVSGSPAGLNCTAGKDFAFDTSGLLLYYCKATGTPGTWQQIPLLTVGGDLSGSLPNPTIAANAVTSAKSAVVNTRRTCSIVIGADNGSTLATADIAPQGRQCYVPYAAHVVEIMVAADAGTPAVVVAKNHGGTLTDLSASLATGSAGALDCANPAGSGTGLDGTTTCTVALTGSAPVALAAGDWIETHTSASASTAKRMSISVTYTVD